MRLNNFFPFLRWFPIKAEFLRSDIIAGITVAMILVPQSMAYANLAGLPVVYGLYASFLPVIVASMWGASKFLHTGPVAMLSLMSAAAIEPLATRGTDEFIQISLLLAFMVGCLRLVLGVFKMGVLMNFTSSPVIVGFTNAAALIIGLSLLNSFLGVPMPRSDNFLNDLFHVIQLLPHAHLTTLVFAIATFIFLIVLSKYLKKLPSVLFAVIFGTMISYYIGFEDNITVEPSQIKDQSSNQIFTKLMSMQDSLALIKEKQKSISDRLEKVDFMDDEAFSLTAESLRLSSEEKIVKNDIYRYKILSHKISLSMSQTGDVKTFAPVEGNTLFKHVYRLSGFKDGKYILAAGGKVVGNIPSGLPGFAVPSFDLDLVKTLFFTSFVIALIGFMEATSISRVLATQSREKLDPNQELIGQGLANIVGSFFQSYVVSGSFSRSAVAAKVGAKTSMFAIFSAVAVVIVMLFLTDYLYHLPKAVLAVIVMTAVFGLINIKPMIQAWKARRADGIAGLATFLATLAMAPRLADGVLIGIVLTIILYLMGNMSPRSEIMGIKKDGTLAGAASHDLPPVSEKFVVMRFDSSLVFVNVAHFEYAVMDAIRYFPKAEAILILGKGINKIDASGEVKLRTLIEDLNSIGVTVAMAGLKSQLLESFEKTGLDEFIGKENIFRDTKTGIQELKEKYG